MTKKMIATDWLAIKSRYVEIIFVTAVMVFFLFGGGFMAVLTILLAAVFAQSHAMEPFIVEEKGDLQQFYLTLPISRKSIVRGRYVFMLACVVVTLVFTVGFTLILSPTIEFLDFRYNLKPEIIIMLGFIAFAGSSLFNSICYPIMFRFGFSKAKIFGFFIPLFIVTGLISLLGLFIGNILRDNPERLFTMITYLSENAEKVTTLVSLISLAVGVLFYALSYCISMRVYARRSF
jgi:hypothetical protein